MVATKTEEVLVDRGEEYGDYQAMCSVIQAIKIPMVRSKNWTKLRDTQRETLELVATKIGRILTGNPNNRDSWTDIEGYIKKAIEYLPMEAEPTVQTLEPHEDQRSALRQIMDRQKRAVHVASGDLETCMVCGKEFPTEYIILGECPDCRH
jgi:hypothetical protein